MIMKICITSKDNMLMDDIYHDLKEDLEEYGLRSEVDILIPGKKKKQEGIQTKGELITTTSVILALVGAGGALTVALGKEGFLTKLASILEAYVKRQVDISIEVEGKKSIKIRGSAKEIKSVLESNFFAKD